MNEELTQFSHATGGHLRMPAAARNTVAHTLVVAKVHLESVIESVQKLGTHCVGVLRQIKTVQGALDKAGQIGLESRLRVNVPTATERGDGQATVEELMDAHRHR